MQQNFKGKLGRKFTAQNKHGTGSYCKLFAVVTLHAYILRAWYLDVSSVCCLSCLSCSAVRASCDGLGLPGM